MKQKYCSSTHPSRATSSSSASHIWKQMILHREEAEDLFVWKIGSGQLYFWLDNWYLKAPLITSWPPSMFTDLTVNQCWDGDTWSPSKLNELVPPDVANDILEIPLNPSTPDSLILKGPNHLNVTKKILFKRHEDIPQWPWSKLIWSSLMKPSMSFFSRRVIYNLLPIDDILKYKGLKLAFRCICCLMEEETLTHLFCSCPAVHPIWNDLSQLFNVPYHPNSTLLSFLKTWGFPKPFSCIYKVVFLSLHHGSSGCTGTARSIRWFLLIPPSVFTTSRVTAYIALFRVRSSLPCFMTPLSSSLGLRKAPIVLSIFSVWLLLPPGSRSILMAAFHQLSLVFSATAPVTVY